MQITMYSVNITHDLCTIYNFYIYQIILENWVASNIVAQKPTIYMWSNFQLNHQANEVRSRIVLQRYVWSSDLQQLILLIFVTSKKDYEGPTFTFDPSKP